MSTVFETISDLLGSIEVKDQFVFPNGSKIWEKPKNGPRVSFKKDYLQRFI